MNRRTFLGSLMLGGIGGASACLAKPSEGPPGAAARAGRGSFELEEWSIRELQAAMTSGKFTAVSLTKRYLARIDQMDRRGPSLNSVIEINPDALSTARELDQERKRSGPRGPLHGVPILLKDNIASRDRMNTTAGSLALLGCTPAQDAFVVRRLRQAGAVLLGKTNLSEWANFRSTHSTSGWSGRGGLTRNPYALDRNPSGSSSGSAVAVAANLCAAAVGTETDGSIMSPSSVCGIVGIKPTVGLVSRAGIIPISESQDTAGPMARTVGDAAILLEALCGADALDRATGRVPRGFATDFGAKLDPNALRGARIGVARAFFDIDARAVKVVEDCLDLIRSLGATVVDPADLPEHETLGHDEMTVLLYEFKDGLNRYLAGLGPEAAVKSLPDLIEFNEKNHLAEMPFFGQEILTQAQEKGPLTETSYLEARERCRRWTQEDGIDAVVKQHRLDALLAPSTGPAAVTDLVYGDRDIGGSSEPAAVAGYPSITVPAGFVCGLPLGISFFGPAFSEGKLIQLAFAFETASTVRRPPRFALALTG